MRDPPGQVDPRAPFESRTQGPVSEERKAALAELLEGIREPEDVLALGERADAQVCGAPGSPPDRAPCSLGVDRGEAVEIDTAVDHLDLAARIWHGPFQTVSEPGRDGYDRVCPSRDERGHRTNAGLALGVCNVLPVRRHDERRARLEGGEQAGRNEKVRVDDVGPEPSRAVPYRPGKAKLAPPAAAAAVDDSSLELVSSCDELALNRLDEDPEIGVFRPGIHLRYEQDPHGSTARSIAAPLGGRLRGRLWAVIVIYSRAMHVAVRLFAAVRERAGTGSLELDLPAGAIVDDVWGALGLGDRPDGLRFAVNRAFVDDGARLVEGDEVAIIPPVSGGDFRLAETPLSLDDVVREVATDEAGAIATFTGTTRGHSRGRDVIRLEYEAYEGMAEETMAALGARLRDRYALCAIAIHHRTGAVEVGESSVVIAASARHRADALAACRDAIDELKVTVPLWKKEIYVGGETWIGQGS